MNYLAPAIGDESFGTAHARHAVLREGTLGLLTVQLLLDYAEPGYVGRERWANAASA